MRSVTVHEAKTQLSQLLRAVEQGEEVEIRRGRTPIALLTARRAPAVEFSALRDGFAGQIGIADEFDELDDAIARAFGVRE
jgi:prevent-host-death family protein